MIIKKQAFARAGLLGNPSDQFFGNTISISIRNFSANVTLYESPELHIEPQYQDSNIFKNIYDLVESVNLSGYYGGTRLIKAAIKRFYEYCKDNRIKIGNKNFSIRYISSIPRQVGMGGSSAIITATMRALLEFYQVKIPLEILPTLVLSVEKDELGIKAGLQDRVIQVYEGCVFMDFNKKYLQEKGYGLYESIDPALLPNLYLAYRTDLSKISGPVFNDVQERYNKEDKKVINTLNRIAEIAIEGKEVLKKKDYIKLSELINENFDQRNKIFNISKSNLEMVEAARSCGASAKFTGSGGAIIGMYNDDEVFAKLIVNLKKLNVRVIKPYIG